MNECKFVFLYQLITNRALLIKATTCIILLENPLQKDSKRA